MKNVNKQNTFEILGWLQNNSVSINPHVKTVRRKKSFTVALQNCLGDVTDTTPILHTVSGIRANLTFPADDSH